jgi:hypothetical protein
MNEVRGRGDGLSLLIKFKDETTNWLENREILVGNVTFRICGFDAWALID